MKISKEVLIREIFYQTLIIFLPTLVVVSLSCLFLDNFIFNNHIYTPKLAEIFDISLILTLLFLRVKITKLSLFSMLSEFLLIGITSSLIYVIWHSLLSWRYVQICQNIKIENVFIIKITYVVLVYIFDAFKNIFRKKDNYYDEAPQPLDLYH